MKEEIALKQFGERLKAAMDKKSMSQEELAFKAGIEEKTVWKLVNGKGDPKFSTIVRVIWALEIEPNEVIPHAK